MRALALLRIVERSLIVAIFLVMVGLFALNVVARQIGGALASDLAWIEETVRLLNLFLVFLAAGLALERGKQVAVDTWRDRLAGRLRLPVRRIIDLTGFTFSAWLAWISGNMAAFVLGTGQRSPTLDLPIGWIYMAPCLGFALLALRYGLSLIGGIDRFGGRA